MNVTSRSLKWAALILLLVWGFCICLFSKDYPSDLVAGWGKWVAKYDRIMSAPNEAMGLAFNGYTMGPVMSHKKIAADHARLNYLLGRYDENPTEANKLNFMKELFELTAASNLIIDPK